MNRWAMVRRVAIQVARRRPDWWREPRRERRKAKAGRIHRKAGIPESCVPPGGCGAFVPPERNSMHVRLEPVGNEKIQVGGTHRERVRLNLKGDDVRLGPDWVDEQDHFRLIRVTILADYPEVLRD